MHLTGKVFLLLLVLSVSAVNGQNEPVQITISKEKAIIDGKTYYLHTVKQGETLFSIAKAYNVPQKDIIALNKDAGVSIKTGQVLRIPFEQVTQLPPSFNSDEYIFHIVEAGQKISTIAEKYNLTKEILYKHNPETEISPLQAGQIIKIPKNGNAEIKKTETLPAFKEHKVKRKETLYSISRTYQLTVDDIIAMNPELNTSDIKTGQIIKIPNASIKTNDYTTPVTTEESPNVAIPDHHEPCTPFAEKTVHNVAFLMPLYLDENKTIVDLDSLAGTKNIEERLLFIRSRYPLEFYEGALLAIDSLKKAGHSFKIYVYDTGRDLQKLTNILNRKELSEMELFIGPFDSLLLEKALVFAANHNIKVVSPLSQNINLLKGNPHLFQVNPRNYQKLKHQFSIWQHRKTKTLFFSNPTILRTRIFIIFLRKG